MLKQRLDLLYSTSTVADSSSAKLNLKGILFCGGYSPAVGRKRENNMSFVHQPWTSWSYPFDSQYGKLKQPMVHKSKKYDFRAKHFRFGDLKSSGNLSGLQDEFPFREEQTPLWPMCPCFSRPLKILGVWIFHFKLPSRELTYPTLGKGKSSSKCHFLGIC